MEPFIEQFKTKIHVLWKPVFPPLNNKKKQKFSRNCELKSSFEGGGETDMFSDLQVYISQF